MATAGARHPPVRVYPGRPEGHAPNPQCVLLARHQGLLCHVGGGRPDPRVGRSAPGQRAPEFGRHRALPGAIARAASAPSRHRRRARQTTGVGESRQDRCCLSRGNPRHARLPPSDSLRRAQRLLEPAENQLRVRSEPARECGVAPPQGRAGNAPKPHAASRQSLPRARGPRQLSGRVQEPLRRLCSQ